LAIYVVAIWYIFPRFGILRQEKSGNPASLSLDPWLRFPKRFETKISLSGFFFVEKENFLASGNVSNKLKCNKKQSGNNYFFIWESFSPGKRGILKLKLKMKGKGRFILDGKK
jgi:hypothetical protein